MMPGNHVAMPDGRHVWEYAPQGATDLAALVKAAAAQVLPDATLTASEQRAVPGDGARLVTTLTRHPGGATVQVHARIDESFTLVYDAVVTRGGAGVPRCRPPSATGVAVAEPVSAAVAAASRAPTTTPTILSDNLTAGANLAAGFAKWSPDSGETVHDRLGAIVGGAMGYEPEDLPWEVPLIELGLDSLMAVRIKNRVEYDFDLPPIQLTAVRDANLYAVEKLIEYAIEHRDEVEELAEHQKTHDAGGDRGRAGRADGRSDAPVAELEAKLRRKRRSPRRLPTIIRRPPTESGGARRSRRRRRTRPARRPSASRRRCRARGPGADAGGRHRGARRRRAAARRRRAGHVRDVGDRHRQVARRHLQRAARARRRDRREDGGSGSPNAPRARSPSRT